MLFRDIINEIKAIAIAVADFFMPRRCLVCGRRLAVSERHLCDRCESDIPYTYFWMLGRNQMADKLNAMVQRRFEAESHEGERWPYEYAAALFFYSSDAGYRKIPQALKYHADFPAGRRYSRRLGERLAGSSLFSDVDMVIPVPLHWSRRWRRGYNQAEVIAREIAAALGCPVRTDLLSRPGRTRTQTRMSVEAKGRNVAHAFRCRPFGGVRHVLLVDDVFTTGATLNACHAAVRAALASAGISPSECRVSVATLAYVGRP
ncbi:MAG: ComF family protein [Bacteroidales bacterium]|nr:ComF family protein [Bacteroidales bacterium]